MVQGYMMPLRPIDEIARARAHVDAHLKGRDALKGRALDDLMCEIHEKVIMGSWAYAIAMRPALKRRCLIDTKWPSQFDRLVPNEIIEHKRAARWLDANRHTSGRWHHIPNGEKRSEMTGARLKSMGLKGGFPDVMIYHPDVIIALELKRLDGGDTADDQTRWLKVLSEAGVIARVVYGSRHLIEVVKRSLALTLETGR